MVLKLYSKTCLKLPLKKKTKTWISRPIIAYYRSKVLQNAPTDMYVQIYIMLCNLSDYI